VNAARDARIPHISARTTKAAATAAAAAAAARCCSLFPSLSSARARCHSLARSLPLALSLSDSASRGAFPFDRRRAALRSGMEAGRIFDELRFSTQYTREK